MVSIAVGSLNMACVGGAAGAVFGTVNAAVGLWTGKMDWSMAVDSIGKYALRGMLAGLAFGPLTAAGKIAGPLIVGIPGLTVGISMYCYEVAFDDFLAALPFLPLGSTPYGWINIMRNEIKTQAAKYNLPPELLASVILCELNQYNIMDWGDEEVLSGKDHSMGIVQMNIGNVRSWVPSVASLFDKEIRLRLYDPSEAIALLAEAMSYWRSTRTSTNYGVTADSWNCITQVKKERFVETYCTAKDEMDSNAGGHNASAYYGVKYGLHVLQRTKLFDSPEYGIYSY
jgi:hypothetical protein